MIHAAFDLVSSARSEMLAEGFEPDFPPGAAAELATIRQQLLTIAEPGDAVRDLRSLLWSSIDNDSSRDLDQIEWAEQGAEGTRVLVAVADVDHAVKTGSALDGHASSQTTSVYTAVKTFPMLPVELSTDLTSLNQNQERQAIVIEFVVAEDGSISQSSVYRALVENKLQLTYEEVGPWLEKTAALPAKLQHSPEMIAQLTLQDQAAALLRQHRERLGALVFNRAEAQPVIANGQVHDVVARKKNRAGDLIEDFMIASNQVMAQTLRTKGVSGIQRVVKSPERWARIVQLAAQHGASLPSQPDSVALANFLKEQKAKDDQHYPDLSLAVIKLLGPGEYVLVRAAESSGGHFSLAVQDYTHSTAPNRRFADLVTQREIKAALSGTEVPYTDDQLAEIAARCTLMEDKARKVERNMGKRVAAVALQARVGQTFEAVVTGVTPKGTFVRVLNPPVEGRVMQGEHGMDVGDRVQVKLLNVDPQRGFIDFGRFA